jgi:hypothetical protein
VAQPVAAQRQRRQQQVARPQRQPEVADPPERDVGELGGEALGADAERRLEDRVQLDDGGSYAAPRYPVTMSPSIVR